MPGRNKTRMGRIFALLLFLIAGLTIGTTATANAGTTLDKIKAAGSLPCGIDTEQPEYSTQDAHGNHGAFDLDICKAVAVAVLGPNAKFTVKPYRDEQDALKALKSGEIALLATGSPNYINTTNTGFGFSRPIFYDYQGFLVNKTMGIRSPRDLAGKKVCFLGGTEIEMQIQGYMKREKIDWLPFSFQEEGEMEAAFITRNCAAITADVSQLAYERIAFKGMARNFEILPDVIAKDPLAMTSGRISKFLAMPLKAILSYASCETSAVMAAQLRVMKAASISPSSWKEKGSQSIFSRFM